MTQTNREENHLYTATMTLGACNELPGLDLNLQEDVWERIFDLMNCKAFQQLVKSLC